MKEAISRKCCGSGRHQISLKRLDFIVFVQLLHYYNALGLFNRLARRSPRLTQEWHLCETNGINRKLCRGDGREIYREIYFLRWMLMLGDFMQAWGPALFPLGICCCCIGYLRPWLCWENSCLFGSKYFAFSAEVEKLGTLGPAVSKV